MQGLKNSLFFDARILAIMIENGPPHVDIFDLFCKVCPRGPQTTQNHTFLVFYRRFCVSFFKYFLSSFADTQVLQMRRICRYAGFADMQILPF